MERNRMTNASSSEIAIPLDSSVLAKIKRDPVVITIQLTLQAVGCDGALHLRAHVSRPRVKRLKGGAKRAASGAG
jgi:hypothetical protein